MKVKVLTKDKEKANGVIGRESLDEDEVYIFVNIYPNSGFHMRQVPFPLDIAFLDKEFGILDIQEMEPENGTATAPNTCHYAVEANRGYFKQNQLKAGDFWKKLYSKMAIKRT